MNEVRIRLGAKRSAVAEDHLWSFAPEPGAAAAPPALLDSLPAAERYVVIVPAERVTLYRLDLPKGPRARVLAALPYQLEERLIEPVEHCEFVPVDGSESDGRLWLAVFERDWLAGVRAALARIARGEVRWVVAGWGWPPPDRDAPGWRLRCDPDQALLSRGGPDLVRLPAAGLELALDHALEHALGADGAPTLHVDAGGDPARLARLAAWAERRRVDLRATSLPDEWHADYARCPWSLFQQRRSRCRRALSRLGSAAAWRPAAWGIGALAGLEIVAALAAWGSASATVGRQEREAAALLRETLGSAVPVVDPLPQLRRHYQARRHAAGQRSGDDFLALLAALSADLPPQFGRAAEVVYERGRLRLAFDAAAVPAGLRGDALARLRAAGWTVDAALSADQRRWTVQAGRS